MRRSNRRVGGSPVREVVVLPGRPLLAVGRRPARRAEVLTALDGASRRMKDLARALDCLGYFDDDDRPRAA